MLYDTHCHLNSSQMYDQRHEFIQKALNEGVKYLNIVGYSLSGSKIAVEIANAYENVFAVVGIGPEDCLETTDADLNEIEALLDHPKVVAIGEIGLDYHWGTVPKEKQHDIFRKFIRMANRHNLPVVIHSRDALQDTFNILKEEKAHGVMHCYSGSAEMAKEFVKIGFKISLAGPVTFKNAKEPKRVAKEIDLKDLLIETDSPYLTPHPYRGKPNDPSYVPLVAKEIAEIKGISIEEVENITTLNALNTFQIERN